MVKLLTKHSKENLQQSVFGFRKVLLISLAALGLSIGITDDAFAASVALPNGGATLGLHPAVFAAADALGMIRGVGRAQNATRLIVTSYEGTGTQNAATFGYRHEFVYAPYRAARLQRSFPDGRTAIEVVRDSRAWNESAPGINPSAVNAGAAYRMAEIYLTPHGALRAAIDADARQVKVSTSAGSSVVTAPVDGGAVRITLGGDNRPVRSEVRLGGRTFAAEFSGYKDFNNYGVFAPEKIIRRENGKVVGELVVSRFVENPYIIVPLPEELNAAATSP